MQSPLKEEINRDFSVVFPLFKQKEGMLWDDNYMHK